MFRKFALAAAAVAAVSAGALSVSTTSAEAGWKGKHFGKHFHGFHLKHHWYGGWRPRYVHYYGGCIKRVWTVNRFGETVLRRVNVCY